MKLPEFSWFEFAIAAAFGAFLVLLLVGRPAWPLVLGLVLILALYAFQKAVPDRRAPKIDAQTVLNLQSQIQRLQGNVSNLNMIVGIKGAPHAPESPKPPTT